MSNTEIIKRRICELNNILGTKFHENTWNNKKGIVHIHYKGAWDNIVSSLEMIVKQDSNNKTKFAKKIKETDEFRKSRELGGEIILSNKFLDLSPQFEVKQNGNKDVDIYFEISSGEEISIEISTLNYKADDEDRIQQDRKAQLNDGRLRVTVYKDVSYKRIKTALESKIEKCQNKKNHCNFVLLYNVAGGDTQDLTNALIGKFSFPIDLNSNSLKDPVLSENGLWLENDRFKKIHGVGLFDWDLKNLSILYQPGLDIPDEVKKVFEDFYEITEMEKI